MIELDTEQTRADIIRQAGATPIGEKWGVVWFVDPATRTTLLLEPEDITVENVKRKMDESRKKFMASGAADRHERERA